MKYIVERDVAAQLSTGQLMHELADRMAGVQFVAGRNLGAMCSESLQRMNRETLDFKPPPSHKARFGCACGRDFGTAQDLEEHCEAHGG